MLGLRFIPVSAARPGLQASGSEVLNGENDSVSCHALPTAHRLARITCELL
jgi:hypothetical protein